MLEIESKPSTFPRDFGSPFLHRDVNPRGHLGFQEAVLFCHPIALYFMNCFLMERSLMNLDQAENLARSFGIAFRRCEEQRTIGNGQFEMPIAPAIVCAAFSIELGLKALILRCGGSPWGH